MVGNVPLTGTTNRITISSANVFNISSSYAGQTSITTLGTIGTGTWHGDAIGDSYISSASTWNSKQAGSTNLTSLSGLTYTASAFVKLTAAGTFSLDTTTYLTSVGT